jgi:pimeloyl-ACP methyl ester carboxylesterase
MAKTTRLLKSFLKLVLPVLLLVAAALVAGGIWLVYTTARPLKTRYLVTPDKYGQLSSRAAQVTEETWTNLDGTSSRGWLLRGADNAPAVVLLHRFGADRSYVLNLGVKLNESTNFTVLMPDQRAHGDTPLVQSSTFGSSETDDLRAALQFVRSLKTPSQTKLTSDTVGVYGVEMGALVAISAAAKDQNIKALALDSVPADSDGLLKAAVDRRFPFASFATAKLAQIGTRFYFYDGSYQRETACETARKVEHRSVLLLAGVDAPDFQDPTSRVAKCFPAGSVTETKLDLSPSGLSIINASLEQSQAYDQRLIDFFRNSLTN